LNERRRTRTVGMRRNIIKQTSGGRIRTYFEFLVSFATMVSGRRVHLP